MDRVAELDPKCQGEGGGSWVASPAGLPLYSPSRRRPRLVQVPTFPNRQVTPLGRCRPEEANLGVSESALHCRPAPYPQVFPQTGEFWKMWVVTVAIVFILIRSTIHKMHRR